MILTLQQAVDQAIRSGRKFGPAGTGKYPYRVGAGDRLMNGDGIVWVTLKFLQGEYELEPIPEKAVLITEVDLERAYTRAITVAYDFATLKKELGL